MNKITKFWNYLDGKKTNIGAFLFMLIWTLEAVVIGVWDFNPHWMIKTIDTLQILAPALTGGGGIHKFVKMYQTSKQPKP